MFLHFADWGWKSHCFCCSWSAAAAFSSSSFLHHNNKGVHVRQVWTLAHYYYYYYYYEPPTAPCSLPRALPSCLLLLLLQRLVQTRRRRRKLSFKQQFSILISFLSHNFIFLFLFFFLFSFSLNMHTATNDERTHGRMDGWTIAGSSRERGPGHILNWINERKQQQQQPWEIGEEKKKGTRTSDKECGDAIRSIMNNC